MLLDVDLKAWAEVLSRSGGVRMWKEECRKSANGGVEVRKRDGEGREMMEIFCQGARGVVNIDCTRKGAGAMKKKEKRRMKRKKKNVSKQGLWGQRCLRRSL
jgi:hypothetical protein